jgi:hypothetical protein
MFTSGATTPGFVMISEQALRFRTAWRVAGPALIGLLLPASGRPAFAQDHEAAASQSCRRQCATQVPQGAESRVEREGLVCLMRCSAAERHMRQQRRPGTPEATGCGTAPTMTGAAPAV